MISIFIVSIVLYLIKILSDYRNFSRLLKIHKMGGIYSNGGVYSERYNIHHLPAQASHKSLPFALTQFGRPEGELGDALKRLDGTTT